MFVNCPEQYRTCSGKVSPHFTENALHKWEKKCLPIKLSTLSSYFLLILLLDEPIWTPKAQINYFVQINTTLKWIGWRENSLQQWKIVLLLILWRKYFPHFVLVVKLWEQADGRERNAFYIFLLWDINCFKFFDGLFMGKHFNLSVMNWRFDIRAWMNQSCSLEGDSLNCWLFLIKAG